MNLEEEMKNLKERGMENPLPLSKMAKILAATLDEAATQWAYKTYWDKKFLKLANINSLVQIEQDRIFNELILAGETVIMLTLNAKDLRQDDNFKDYLLKVSEEIPNAHDETLKELGLEREHRRNWKKLIKMRFEEYDTSKTAAREAMMEYYSREKELKPSDLEEMNLFLPPFTVGVGLHSHILRGKTKGKELLYKFLIKKLSRFYTQIRIMTEGGQITPVQKVRMQAQHFWNDLKDKLKDKF